MKLINKSKLTFSGSHVVSNIDASSSGETAHQGKGTADENFRLSPNFSAGATRAPVQLLPPWRKNILHKVHNVQWLRSALALISILKRVYIVSKNS